jgi:DNA-binding MarR family transcriptional regulator
MAALPPLPDPFAELLGYHLRRLSQLVMGDLAERLDALELRPTEASVLFVIAATPGVTQSDIGRMLGIKRANMAPMVAALEARGLVSRSAVDGRSQALRLTADGESMRARARNATRENERRSFASLSDAERAALIGRLQGLWEKLEA